MANIVIHLAHAKNQDLLIDFLQSDHHIITTNFSDLSDCNPDLCITDIELLEEGRSELIQAKKASHLFLPVLLLVQNPTPQIYAYWDNGTIDEMVPIPISKDILTLRIQSLLRTRQLSKEAEERYKALANNSLVGVAIVQEGQIKYSNQALLDLLQMDLDEISSIPFQQLVVPDDRERVLRNYRKRATGNAAPPRYEIQLQTKEDARWVEIAPVRVQYYGQPATFTLIMDIHDRKHAQIELEQSEKQFRHIFEQLPVGYYRRSPEGTFLLVNPKLLDILGATKADLIGERMYDLSYFRHYPIEEFQTQIREQGKVRNLESTLVDSTGEEHAILENAHPDYDESGSIIFYEGTFEDITHLKTLEQELVEMQKMEALGQVAGGIAHDFNNIMASISGAAELLRMQIDAGSENKYISMIENSIDRATAITNRLQHFSHSSEPERHPVSSLEFLHSFKEFATQILSTGVQIVVQTTAQRDLISVNKEQLEQVLLNLAINADHAMSGTGTLTLGVRSPNPDEHQHFPNADQEYLCITVSDEGEGMDEPTQEKIFEPFFTTKDVDKGTGLGLSVVYNVIQNHSGWIDVRSEEGEGTTFILGLPCTEQKSAEAEPQERLRDIPQGTGQHILVIEDEEVIRNTIQKYLETNGFQVTAEANGHSGVEFFEDNSTKVDLVITDLGLPKMKGKEVIQRMSQLNCHVPIIVMSGYIEDTVKEELMQFNVKKIVQKPYKYAEVVRYVAEELID